MNKTLSIYKNKKIVVTGATGFKGSWLCFWLHLLKANIVGISLKPEKDSILYKKLSIHKKIKQYFINIQDSKKLDKVIKKEKPDLIIHLAAQSIVSLGYKDPKTTIKTNVIGSLNILESVRKNNIKNLIYITSDKCYLNKDEKTIYRESDRLGGEDLYSASKASAEIVFEAYVKSFFFNNKKINFATARAGNVIGGGDWSENRLIPDAIRSINKKQTIFLRNPYFNRPWQHVLEPLSGYLRLAIELKNQSTVHGEAFNFGPPAKQNQSVLELVEAMALYWNQVKWEDVSSSEIGPYESGLLKLNCDKALSFLNWNAVMGFEDTVRMTAEWYSNFYNNPIDISNTTNNQIEEYINLAVLEGLDWAK